MELQQKMTAEQEAQAQADFYQMHFQDAAWDSSDMERAAKFIMWRVREEKRPVDLAYTNLLKTAEHCIELAERLEKAWYEYAKQSTH